MYKKIKNGSFMNWIWFIVSIMPILLLVIYSISNSINKDNQTTRINNLINYSNDFVSSQEETDIGYINTYNSSLLNTTYLIYDFGNNQTFTSNNYIEFEMGRDDEYYAYSEEYFYFNTLNENKNFYMYIYYTTTSEQSHFIFNDGLNGSKDLEKNVIYEFACNLNNEGFPDIAYYVAPNEYYYGELFLFASYNRISKEVFNGLTNWNYVDVNGNINYYYENYISNFLITIQTNGFISDAFLNFAQFFGADNVYYSLACYYIEYLLVIALLHLAFDVLYMLPNICHKFMEKIGGERD